MCFVIEESNNILKSYNLVSYNICSKENYVILKLVSEKSITTYELRTDDIYKDIKQIIDYLNDILNIAKNKQCPIKITEFSERSYVSIGVETSEIFKSKRFTAFKI